MPDRDAATVSVRKQFTDDQVTRSRKLEGQWWGDGGAYFVASFARTSDGSVNEHDGQVWFYDPRPRDRHAEDHLRRQPGPGRRHRTTTARTTSPSRRTAASSSPRTARASQHLVGVTEQGKAYPLARNELNDSEFTGPAFSADGEILFANIQTPGHVFAITGPWRRRHGN